MARALTAGTPTRRRAFFGLLDADGWGWASLKAFFWFVVIIFVLGYVPDRAYYFTVSRTIDLGILAWSPVNLCPPENETLPCPAPVGAVLPWHPSPPELALPSARADAAFVQAGTKVLLIGGSDGTTATDSVFVAETVGTGNFDRWEEGPALPEPRSDAGVAVFNGVIYVTGGYDADGAPTDTTYVLTPNLQTGDLGEWQTAEDLEQDIDLPDPRAAAPLVPLSDGLLLVGGVGPDGNPVPTVWKATADASSGELGAWTPQTQLAQPVSDASAVLNGDFVWVLGGRDPSGNPTALVQRASATTDNLEEGDPGGGDSSVDAEPSSAGGVGGGDSPDDQPGAGSPAPGAASPEPSAVAPSLGQWGVNSRANLPAPRADAMAHAANGTIYLVGGNDGQSEANELYWAVPTAGSDGDDITEWKHLDQTDLAEPGLERAAIGVVGPNLFLVGGVSGGQPQVGSLRANTSPQAPFFQLGLVGAVVPGLKIEGEIGQQLGYLNAAGAGGTMFAILLIIGYLFAHREQTARMWDRVRRR
jgi:N-acetylneuraminic acid mutarotase